MASSDIRLAERRGRAQELDSRHADALASYEQAEAVATERNLPRLALHAVTFQGTLRSVINDQFNPELAQKLAARGLEMAQALGDEIAEARIYWNLLNV